MREQQVDGDIGIRLQRSRRSHIVHELFTNTLHFPLVNIILEFQLNKAFDYLYGIDLYLILIASLVQGAVYGNWQFLGRRRQLLGNLIAPALYTVLGVQLIGWEFLLAPNHLAYWVFALTLGLAQQLRNSRSDELRDAMILTEGVVRTGIVLVGYIIFELQGEEYDSVQAFMRDGTHQFLTASIPLLGLVFGFANINSERYLTVLMRTAEQLRQYSEWHLGRDLLSKAVDNPNVLGLKRVERTILFMDIRGFTGWSENRTPEEVVTVMNAYYEAAESIWKERNVIKVKLTADEVMLVFDTPAEAVWAATALREASYQMLMEHGLQAGLGLHVGPVVEGVMGSREHKSYDLLGDCVNTAKRICEHAHGGEILVSNELRTMLGGLFDFGQDRQIKAKGKVEPITVWQLRNWRG